MKNDLIQIYYDLYEILDDNIIIAKHIKKVSKKKYSVRKIIYLLENLRLDKIDNELNILYDMKMEDLKKFKRVYMLKNEMLQSSMDLF